MSGGNNPVFDHLGGLVHRNASSCSQCHCSKQKLHVKFPLVTGDLVCADLLTIACVIGQLLSVRYEVVHRQAAIGRVALLVLRFELGG